MAWVWCQSCAGLGVCVLVARLGEPDLLVPGIPEIAICPSLTHTHTTHVHTHPLTPLLCHTLFFPAVLLAIMFEFPVVQTCTLEKLF